MANMLDSLSFFIIDDEEDIVKLLKAILEARGHRVEGFSSVNKFYDRLMLEDPDVVIVDMINREAPGWLICENVRNLTGREDLKIIAMSGVLDGDDVDRIKLKADIFIPKPISGEVIEQALCTLFCASADDVADAANVVGNISV